jgi:hypothetical protein
MGDLAQFELVIRAALSSENSSRQQAEATFKQALAHADSFLGLTMQTIQSSSGHARPCYEHAWRVALHCMRRDVCLASPNSPCPLQTSACVSSRL